MTESVPREALQHNWGASTILRARLHMRTEAERRRTPGGLSPGVCARRVGGTCVPHGFLVTALFVADRGRVLVVIRWGIHPEDLITHRVTLDRVGEAYSLMASGRCGKVAAVFDEEVK